MSDADALQNLHIQKVPYTTSRVAVYPITRIQQISTLFQAVSILRHLERCGIGWLPGQNILPMKHRFVSILCGVYKGVRSLLYIVSHIWYVFHCFLYTIRFPFY